jgi:ligand-binding sensor domain-containing protein
MGKSNQHLCEDNEGRIWVATSYGLLVFDANNMVENKYKFIAYRKIPGNHNSLGNNSVQYICKDKTGQIWIGTFGGGLNKANLGNNNINNVSFESFTTANGLSNDVILSITVDRRNNLWLATAGGLSKFNPQHQSFKNYDSGDGLPNTAFSEATCFTTPDDKLYFGCVNGYFSFNPGDISHRKIAANMALTHMQLYYKDILPGGR